MLPPNLQSENMKRLGNHGILVVQHSVLSAQRYLNKVVTTRPYTIDGMLQYSGGTHRKENDDFAVDEIVTSFEKSLDPRCPNPYSDPRYAAVTSSPVAQLAEQVTVNHLVRGSSPRRRAKH